MEKERERRFPWNISGILVAALALAGCARVYQESIATKNPVTPELPTAELPIPELIPVRTTIQAVGDMNLGRYVNVKSAKYGDFFWPFLLIEGQLPEADISIGNLESPIHLGCPATGMGLRLCAPSEAVLALSRFGFDVVNIANNHILDYGQDGQEETIRFLSEAGIGASDEEHLVVIDREGIRFGFIGFNRIGQWENFPVLTDEEVLSRITESKSRVDVLIVSLHWGEEEKPQNKNQIDLGRAAVGAGADIIIGTHPHITQPTEKYGESVIFYSLGNFVFDQKQTRYVQEGNVAEIVFEGSDMTSYKLIPVKIENWGQPRLTNGE